MSNNFLYDSEERLKQLVKRDGTNESDIERKAMFYILAGNYDLYNKIDFIYDFKDHNINIDCLENEDVDFSSSSSNLIKLAFNLYNGYPADVLSTFVGLDDSNFALALKAIEIRFGKMDVNIVND